MHSQRDGAAFPRHARLYHRAVSATTRPTLSSGHEYPGGPKIVFDVRLQWWSGRLRRTDVSVLLATMLMLLSVAERVVEQQEDFEVAS